MHELQLLSVVALLEDIHNPGLMDHPFHLHVNPFQAVEADGTIQRPAWFDVVNIPRRSTRRIRARFADFSGKTVYHCHILDHEDSGMMGTLEIGAGGRPVIVPSLIQSSMFSR